MNSQRSTPSVGVPARSSKASGRVRGLLGLLGLLALFFASQAGSSREPVDGSATSSDPRGFRAALLILGALDWPAELFRSRPAALPRKRVILWMDRVPIGQGSLVTPEDSEDDRSDNSNESSGDSGSNNPSNSEPEIESRVEPRPDSLEVTVGEDEAEDAATEAWRGGPRSPWHYLRFLEEGGVIVLPGGSQERRWLEKELDLKRVAILRSRLLDRAPQRVFLDSQPFELETKHRRALLGPNEFRDIGFSEEGLAESEFEFEEMEGAAKEWQTLLRTESGDVLAASLPVGRGRLVLLARNQMFNNKELRNAEHGELLVELLEKVGDGRRLPVLFDEFVTGVWSREGLFRLAFSPKARWVSLHFLVLGLMGLWWLVSRRDFPRRPFDALGRPAGERVQSRAAWLERRDFHPGLHPSLQTGDLRAPQSFDLLDDSGRQPESS